MKNSLVFPGRKGPLTDIRASLNGACERAGVPHIHIHGLRHTFGSQMATAGADPFAIIKAMGHTDIRTTMIYVSLGKSHIRDQVEKLNAIRLLPSPARGIKALSAPACSVQGDFALSRIPVRRHDRRREGERVIDMTAKSK